MVDYTVDSIVDCNVYVVHYMVDYTIDYTIDYNVSIVHSTIECSIDRCVVSYTNYEFSSMIVKLDKFINLFPRN